MERKQFTFYRSFMDGIKRIKAKAARCEAYDAIIAYALDGTEPDLDKLSDAAALAFVMAKPNLDSARKKAEAGQKGGESKDQANGKQTASKPQANRKQEKEQEKEQDIEQMLKENTKEKRSIRFVPPTLDEVKAYVAEKGYKVDPVAWWHHYDGNGWMCGKTPMKNWKSAIVTWTRSDFSKAPAKNSPEYFGKGNIDPAVVRRAFLQNQLEEEDSA